MSIFDTFERKHDYLVCVDSDGCVMDTMNCKHFHCFGPCMVTEWGLEEWKEEILDRWNVINLFSMTRGINRFKGLAMALKEIDGKYTKITGVDALVHWADTAPALSNDGVAKAAAETTDPDAKLVLEKALSWSKAVNAAIVELPEELKVPYNGAKEGLAAAHSFADVAMVSSANRDAVEEEWGKFGLLEHTDIMIPSEEFALGHTGKDNAELAAKALYERYKPEVVIVTQGKKGGILFDGDKITSYPVYPAEVVDSNGSGDVFHGAFAAGLVRGFDFYKCCHFASAASAIKCMGVGARESVPDLDTVKKYSTVEKYLKENGYEL